MTDHPIDEQQRESQPPFRTPPAFLNAPIDDEPWTEDDQRELDEARAEADRLGWIPFEEIIAEFGIDIEEPEWHGESSLSERARKDLRAIGNPTAKRINRAIARLADDMAGADTKKLAGTASDWRLRVGDYRVIFTLSNANGEIEIGRILHRRDAY